MKRPSSTVLFLSTVFTFCVASCNKEGEQTPDPISASTPTPALTLPITVDFKTIPSANGKASFEAGGLTFTGAGAKTATDFDSIYVKCIDANSTNIRHGSSGVTLAYDNFNTLIADVSALPAMQKITVKALNNNQQYTHLSLCDGSGVIARTNQFTGSNPEVTYTMNVGGKTASKFYIFSREAGVHSVTFE